MRLKYEYDNIVIGNDLKAVYFAFKEGYPIILSELRKPFNADELLNGENKKQLMEYYISLLSLAGLVPFAIKVDNIRIEDKKVFVSGKRPWLAEITINDTIHNFLDSKVHKKTLFKVVDWIDTRSCGLHEFREINDKKDNFVKQIIFYPSYRDPEARLFDIVKSDKKYGDLTKDIQAISYLTEKQIEDPEFSPVYSRIKVKAMMLESGIIGKKKGFENRPHKKAYGQQRYKGITLQFAKREIFKIDNEEEYDFTSKNEYINRLVDFLWKKNKKNKQVLKVNITSISPE